MEYELGSCLRRQFQSTLGYLILLTLVGPGLEPGGEGGPGLPYALEDKGGRDAVSSEARVYSPQKLGGGLKTLPFVGDIELVCLVGLC